MVWKLQTTHIGFLSSPVVKDSLTHVPMPSRLHFKIGSHDIAENLRLFEEGKMSCAR